MPAKWRCCVSPRGCGSGKSSARHRCSNISKTSSDMDRRSRTVSVKAVAARSSILPETMLGIQTHDGDGIPVTGVSGPAPWAPLASRQVHAMPLLKDLGLATIVTLAGRNEADAAVLVVFVVPIDEARHPATSAVDGDKGPVGKIRSVFHRSKKRFCEWIVVAHSGAAK